MMPDATAMPRGSPWARATALLTSAAANTVSAVPRISQPQMNDRASPPAPLHSLVLGSPYSSHGFTVSPSVAIRKTPIIPTQRLQRNQIATPGLVASRQGSGVFVRDLKPDPSGLEAALGEALASGDADVDYLGTNPIDLARALEQRGEAAAAGSQTRLTARILAPVRDGLTAAQIELELTGVSDLRRLAQEAERDAAISVALEERRTTRMPMFELYVVNGVEFVAFIGIDGGARTADFQVHEPASKQSPRPRELFVDLCKDAEPGAVG